MISNWHRIWNRRSGLASTWDLQDLIDLDGFDSGAGRIAAADWREYIRRIAGRIEMTNETSVYEVGCGAGAFLFASRELLGLRMIGGCDYGAKLVEAANQVFEGDDFTVTEAVNVCTKTKYDIVLANSVFHYFPDCDYAAVVLEKMIQKANRTIAILEVPHAKTREESERMRRDQFTVEQYEAKYAGLEHLYYSPEWFGKIAEKHGCAWEHFGQIIPNYLQSRYRFNVLIRKNA